MLKMKKKKIPSSNDRTSDPGITLSMWGWMDDNVRIRMQGIGISVLSGPRHYKKKAFIKLGFDIFQGLSLQLQNFKLEHYQFNAGSLLRAVFLLHTILLLRLHSSKAAGGPHQTWRCQLGYSRGRIDSKRNKELVLLHITPRYIRECYIVRFHYVGIDQRN